ncbi:MAG: bifunctional methylenetetrahydrofolate dehydrogenase/methenyltetrahydrofolate cyclohydrolase FolD [Chloroflexota bacterium]
MTARIIDGRAVATAVLDSISARAADLQAREIHPALAFVMVGQSEPARLYARRLHTLARPLGIECREVHLPLAATQKELESTVCILSRDAQVDGILVQMPLPSHLTHANLGELLDARKDVDGITIDNAGRLYLEMPGHFPSTALAMMEILDSCGVNVTGKHAVVVGRSKIVGHPVAELLLRRDATVTVTHRQTRDLASHTRRAEILMVGAGEPHLVRGDMLLPGVVVVDAGINPTANGLVGDVHFEQAKLVAAAISPVPGGVGPVTNAVLLRSVVASAEQRRV